MAILRVALPVQLDGPTNGLNRLSLLEISHYLQVWSLQLQYLFNLSVLPLRQIDGEELALDSCGVERHNVFDNMRDAIRVGLC